MQQRLHQFATSQGSVPPVITVAIDEPTQLPVVFVDGQQFLTVTNLDAQFSSYVSPGEYAVVLRNTIETAFERYRTERQPDFLRQQAQWAVGIVVGTFLLIFGSKYVQQRLQHRQKGLVSANTQLGKPL